MASRRSLTTSSPSTPLAWKALVQDSKTLCNTNGEEQLKTHCIVFLHNGGGGEGNANIFSFHLWLNEKCCMLQQHQATITVPWLSSESTIGCLTLATTVTGFKFSESHKNPAWKTTQLFYYMYNNNNGMNKKAHLIQLGLLAGEGEGEAQGKLLLLYVHLLREVSEALCNVVE